MKRKLILFLVLLGMFAPSALAQYTTPIATAIAASTNTMNVTTAPITTTGKDICWVFVSAFAVLGTTDVTVTDSLNGATAYTKDHFGTDSTVNPYILQYHLRGLTVGAGHTFTATCTGNPCYPQAMGVCSSGSASSPFDVANSLGDAGTAVNTELSGSLTPTISNCILFSGLSYRSTAADATISTAGFTLLGAARETGNPAIGLGVAYKIVTSGCNVAVNATWTWTGAAALAVSDITSWNATGSTDVMVFSSQPTDLVSGSTFTPTVRVTANLAGGGTDTAFTGNVLLAMNACGAATIGTFTQAAVAGVATFTGLGAMNVATGCTLTANNATMPSVTSTAFNVTSGGGGLYTIGPHTFSQSSDTLTATTTGLNTTGMDICWVGTASYSSLAIAVTDNKGNGTFTTSPPARQTDIVMMPYVQLHYKQGLSVGTTHTFTATCSGGACYPAIFVLCASGSAAGPLDQENGAGDVGGTGITTLTTGSVTPTASNEIVIAVLAYRDTGSEATINSGFTIAEVKRESGSPAIGGGLAYKIQTTAAAVNPAWSWTNGALAAAKDATFRNGTSGGGGGADNLAGRLSTLGVGR